MPRTDSLMQRLGMDVPLMLAPMALASGGRLAAAVTSAGGLGFIGGGYGDRHLLMREFDAAGDATVGVGFMTWSLAKQPRRLDLALARNPRALLLLFEPPMPRV